MKMFLYMLVPIVFAGYSMTGSCNEITLREILRKAAAVSPEVATSRLKAAASESQIGVERAGYMPTINLEAGDSTGFPGSVGHMGIEGILASPFRDGSAADVSATIPIWDFGRTLYSVEAAKHDAISQQHYANYTRYRVYETSNQYFYECSMDRQLEDAWKELFKGARLVRDLVNEFVKTGQRSIVERYLVESQLEHARTQIEYYKQRKTYMVKEIGLLTGISADSFTCPDLPPEDQAIAIFHGTPQGNPIIEQAKEAMLAAQSRVDYARSDYLPKLMAVADLGTMQNDRLVNDQNYYALGVAIIFPLFEGLKTVNQVDENKALAASAQKELESRQLEIDELNARYDKLIVSSRTALKMLHDEFTIANKGFFLAKKRYKTMQGGVLDVREAFNNVMRVQANLITTQATYMQSMSAKAILNGTPF